MRRDCEVKLFQVNTFGLDSVRKDIRIISGIEQVALAAIFDEGREPPILLHRGGLAEGIVEDGDLGCARLSGCRGDPNGCRGDRYGGQLEKDMLCHHLAPSTMRVNAWHRHQRPDSTRT